LGHRVESESISARAMPAASITCGRAERECGTAVPETKAPLGGSQPHRGHFKQKYSSSFVPLQVLAPPGLIFTNLLIASLDGLSLQRRRQRPANFWNWLITSAFEHYLTLWWRGAWRQHH
jgi:hypothetical protein